MVKDAEAHADEDAKRKEEIEARNNCDSLVNATETTLNELGDKVPADSKSTVEAAIAEAKTALEGTDIDAIKLLPRSCSRQATSWPKLPIATRTLPLPLLAPRVLLLSRMTAPSRPTTRSSTTRTKGNNHEQGR